MCACINCLLHYSSVSSMLEQLSWPTLQFRHKLSRLQTLHKALYHQISLTIPLYFLQPSRSTRQYHLLHNILPQPSTTAYQYSYFYRTINDWNKLPVNLFELTDTDSLKMKFNHYCNCMSKHTSRADCSVIIIIISTRWICWSRSQ